MSELQKALVDVPVRVNIWIRRECQIKQFEIIKKAKPSILFLQSDGGRNDKEWEIIRANRKYIDSSIDWECRVYRLYENHNNGLYAMAKKTSQLIWNTVDRCVFLEDDDIPAVSFFAFCKEMLDRYENDLRVQGICGFNVEGVWKDVQSDYFFSGESNPWGTATWKRSYELLHKENFEYINDPYTLTLLKKHLGGYGYKGAVRCAKNRLIDGHQPGGEFFRGISRALQNALFIVPKKNLISNYGCGFDSVHSTSYKTLSKAEKKLFYSKTYELEFPLKHPNYVIRDTIFEKTVRKRSGYGKTHVRFWRRFVKSLKLLRYGGVKALNDKISKVKNNKNEK